VTELLQGLVRNEEGEEGFDSYTMKLSVVEMHKERVRDLLSNCDDLKICHDKNTFCFSVHNVSEVEMRSLVEAMTQILAAYCARVTHGTAMNDHSS